MKILIFEDEHHAAIRIQSLIHKLIIDADILDVIDSVEDGIEWFNKNIEVDLIFMDIQLADGVSFSIFQEVDIEAPIIFTTAFDQYSLKAFKVNSIDYLLKPIDEIELQNAIEKYQKLNQSNNSIPFSTLERILVKSQNNKIYKERFLIKSGETYNFILADEIAYFYSEDSLTFIITKKGKRYIYDQTLSQLESDLNPQYFFRINRKQIISLNSIKSIHNYFNSRVKIEIDPIPKDDVIVSRDKVKLFKNWLDR